VASVATFIFGAVHASVAPRVMSGRRRSRSLSVRADVAPPHLARLVIAALLALAGVTVAVSLAVAADGASHPTTIASVVVALLIVLGGPRLLDVMRRRARASAS
jgi:protein-S-isoprenylcysteine O-methyltransferase Ste14